MNATLSHEIVLQNLALFRELISCEGTMYHWVYQKGGSLMETNCHRLVLHTIFERTGSLSFMCDAFEKAETESEETPLLVLGGPLGLMWSATMEYSDGMACYHVIGPAKRLEVTQSAVEEAAHTANIDPTWRNDFVELIASLPTGGVTMFIRYALMLYYCITGKKISRSDIIYQTESSVRPDAVKFNELPKDRQATYAAEQALLYCIREGNTDYKRTFRRAGELSTGIRVSTHYPINQAILSTATFTSLCVRAAIEGGLSPDLAYTIGDRYIQSMTKCKNASELAAINHTMYEDFVQRVHQIRMNHQYSQAILSCCEYIRLHVEDEIKLQDIAKAHGYTEYYLSRKFKQEVGMSVQQYIHAERINRAKFLLSATDLSISQIAEHLHFSSSTHFSSTFRNLTGMLPSEYRAPEHTEKSTK